MYHVMGYAMNDVGTRHMRVERSAKCAGVGHAGVPVSPLRLPRGVTGASLSVDCGKRLLTHIAKARHYVVL